jgi:cell division protein FtsI/penicillin-binding protein 2
MAVNMHKAIVVSCDTYFYILSYQMGIDKMNEWMRQFGLVKKLVSIYQVKVQVYIQVLNGNRKANG